MRGDKDLKTLGIVFLFLGMFQPLAFIIGVLLLVLYMRPDILDRKDKSNESYHKAPTDDSSGPRQTHQKPRNTAPRSDAPLYFE